MSPRIPAITVGTYHLMGGEGRVCNPEETCLGQVPQPHAETREAQHPVPPRPPPPGQMAIALWTRGLPCGSAGKESACNAGDPGSIPGSGISAGERTGCPLQYSGASLVAQLVKNPPAMQETWVWSLGREDPLEKGTATHSSTLAWRIPWTV